MSELLITFERKGRMAAYNGDDGVVYYHRKIKGEICDLNIWHYIAGIVEVELRREMGHVDSIQPDISDRRAMTAHIAELTKASDYMRRIAELKERWVPNSEGLLFALLNRAVDLQDLPPVSTIYALQADETTDDLSWGPGRWDVGLIGVEKTEEELILDIHLDNALLQADEDVRSQAYGYAAASVAMKCVGYDRGDEHPLRSVMVRADPNLESPFTEFDYVRDRLEIDQAVDIQRVDRPGKAMQAGLVAVRAFHDEELAMLDR